MKDWWERDTSGHKDMAYSWTWLAQLKYWLPEAGNSMRHATLWQCLFGCDLATQHTRQNDQRLKCGMLWLTWHTAAVTTAYCQRLAAPFTFKSNNPISSLFTSRRTVLCSSFQSHFHQFWFWLSLPFLIHFINIAWNYQNSSLKTTWTFSPTQHILRTHFSSAFHLVSTMISSNFSVFWGLCPYFRNLAYHGMLAVLLPIHFWQQKLESVA